MDYTYINITGATARLIQGKSNRSTIGSSEVGSRNSFRENNYTSDYNTKVPLMKGMSLCNIHSTDSVNVDLYAYLVEINQSNNPSRGQVDEHNTLDVVADTYLTYYLLKNLTIPKGVTLNLDENELCYDKKYYDLYIKLNASDSAVDVTIKTY
tara:strand:+ start:1958 stop:2416 length:459 start_codon:yes stop_codon:yes gene_type:complete